MIREGVLKVAELQRRLGKREENSKHGDKCMQRPWVWDKIGRSRAQSRPEGVDQGTRGRAEDGEIREVCGGRILGGVVCVLLATGSY